jgi:transglutaminase-like putative cysteine protease
MLRLGIVPLRSFGQTIREMKRLPRRYASDVLPYKNLNLVEYYNFIKKLPYIPDPKGHEFIQRPLVTFSKKALYRDCDDKAVAMAAYFIFKNIPFRYVVTSSRADKALHHIYTEIYFNGLWRPVDATYPENTLFKERAFTKKIVY